MIDKEKIKNNFSKYATYYDTYATVQNMCASSLIKMLDMDNFKKILDIGCGTGNYTRLLREKFPRACIKAIDISEQMIKVAKKKLSAKGGSALGGKNENIEFIVKDAEIINVKEKFDLISSNASFQWFEDLKRALINYKEALNRNGIIAFSIFGPLTFYELDESLKKLDRNYASINSCSFIGREDMVGILRDIFKNVEVKQKIFKERYDSIGELLKSIKYTGTQGNGIYRGNLWTKKYLCTLEKIYRKRFGNIIATYQIFFCKAKGDTLQHKKATC